MGNSSQITLGKVDKVREVMSQVLVDNLPGEFWARRAGYHGPLLSGTRAVPVPEGPLTLLARPVLGLQLNGADLLSVLTGKPIVALAFENMVYNAC